MLTIQSQFVRLAPKTHKVTLELSKSDTWKLVEILRACDDEHWRKDAERIRDALLSNH